MLFNQIGIATVTWTDPADVCRRFHGGLWAGYQFIRYYIFRRIKLIWHKIIHRHKLPSDFKAGKLDMSKNILENVEK